MSEAHTVFNDDQTFTSTPADNHSTSTAYKLRITTSVTDNSSNSLASAYTTNGFTISPSGSGTIGGSVKLGNGNALSEVSVGFSIYGTTARTTTADSNGDFSQSDTLATDNLTLTVETITQLPDSCSSGTISGSITDAVSGGNVSSVGLYS